MRGCQRTSGVGVAGVVVVAVVVCVLLVGSSTQAQARTIESGERCNGTSAFSFDGGWKGECRNVSKASKKDIEFCRDYVSDSVFSCMPNGASFKKRDEWAKEEYKEYKDYVIKTAHLYDTITIDQIPLCKEQLKVFVCTEAFPTCGKDECQSCTPLNNWLETCLGQGAANYRLCRNKVWPSGKERKEMNCDCCQNIPIVDLTNFYDDQGHIDRIDQHTGVNLWSANHEIAITSCSLSVIGSFAIIISFFVFRDRLKTFHLRLVFYLSINDFLQAFLHGIDHAYNLAHGYVVPGALCQAAGWWIGTFLVGNICWMIAIVYYLHKFVVRQKKDFMPEWLLVIICFGLPNYHLFPLIKFEHVRYGPRGDWCYIPDGETAWQVVFLAVPTFVGFFVTASLYGHIIAHISWVGNKIGKMEAKSPSKTERRKHKWRVQRRLLGYPVIFLLQWTPLVVEFILVWAGASLYAVTICDLFTVWWVNFSGFMNFIWFSYNERLPARWWKLITGGGIQPVTSDLSEAKTRSASATSGVLSTKQTATTTTTTANTSRSSTSQ